MRFRSPQPEDAGAVLEVIVARDIADLGMPDYTLADLLDEWRAEEFDLATDAVLAVDDEAGVVGYAAIHGPGSVAVVAPGHEGRGIGTRLLEWTEQRDLAIGRPRHRQAIPTTDSRARALLLSAGYKHARSYTRLVRRLDDVDASETPVGVTFRALNVKTDARAIHELDAASFAGNPDYRSKTFTQFRDEHLTAHDLDPTLGCGVERDGKLVGFVLARRWQDENAGFIALLAVHPDHRRQGIATAMLLRTFARFAAAGLAEAQLGVASDNPRALTLYERAGMTTRFRLDSYERDAG